MPLRVNPSANTISRGNTRLQGRCRWEASVLALLAQADGRPVEASELHAVLSAQGQLTPLNRKAISRVLASLDAMLAQLLGEAQPPPFARQRGATTGPWRWNPATPIPVCIETALRPTTFGTAALDAGEANTADAAVAAPRLAPLDDEGPSLAAVELVLKADQLALAGLLDNAVQLLGTGLRLPGISLEFTGLLQLRLAKHLRHLGRFDEAQEALELLRQQARQAAYPDPGQRWLAELQLVRINYDRSPPEHLLEVQGRLGSLGLLPMPDLRGLGELENLRGLVWRRRGIEANRLGQAALALRCYQLAWHHISRALYWALSGRDHENCHNFLTNLGIAQHGLHELGVDKALHHTYRCYRLSIFCNDAFGVGDDSLWDRVMIGHLWLDNPAQRSEFESGLAFGCSDPGQLSFYEECVAMATRLRDPRQLAMCQLNLWRYAQTLAADEGKPLLARTRAALAETLLGQPELRRALCKDAAPEIAALLMTL